MRVFLESNLVYCYSQGLFCFLSQLTTMLNYSYPCWILVMDLTLDHINICTNELEVVRDTLVRLLGLEQGYRPPFPMEGVWLYGNGYPIVHLSKRKEDPGNDSGSVDHIAFKGSDYEALKKRLDLDGVGYVEKIVPVTGVRQVFFRVNHELKIEVDFSPVG